MLLVLIEEVVIMDIQVVLAPPIQEEEALHLEQNLVEDLELLIVV